MSHIFKIIGFIKKYKKYKIVRIWPTKIYGSSAGRAPIQVNKITIFTINQKEIWATG
jgi:hypothetical protein